MRGFFSALWAISALLVLFLTLPMAYTSVWGVWAGLALTGVWCTLGVAHRQWLMRWQAYGLLAGSFMLSLAWLRWLAPMLSFPALNAFLGVLAWGLFVGLMLSSLFLLLYRDASVIFMGAAWVLVTLVLIGVGQGYGTLERFSTTPLTVQVWWGAPMIWGMFMLCLGPLFFLGHLAWLIRREWGAE